MTRQIEVTVPGINKLTITVIDTGRFINATAGDITCDGDLNLRTVKAAIQKELATELPINLKVGNIDCGGNVTF